MNMQKDSIHYVYIWSQALKNNLFCKVWIIAKTQESIKLSKWGVKDLLKKFLTYTASKT